MAALASGGGVGPGGALGTGVNATPLTASTPQPAPPSTASHGAVAEDRTFLTALRGATATDTVHVSGMDRVKQLHTQLTSVVGALNDKVTAVLKKQESEFLRAYRAHMYSVQKELAQLRAKADDAALQLAKNEKIRVLEAERDWYRGEALRLDSFCTSLKADVEYMRDKLAAVEDDRAWLERQLKGSRRREALATTVGSRGGGDDTHPVGMGEGEDVRPGHGRSPPGSADVEPGGVAVHAPSPTATSPPGTTAGHVAPLALPSHTSHVDHDVTAGGGMPASHGVEQKGVAGRRTWGLGGSGMARTGAPVTIAPLLIGTGTGLTAPTKPAVVDGGNNAAETAELKAQLAAAMRLVDGLKARNERLTAANSALRGDRGELESFFLQCVEEGRRDIARRRLRSLASTKAVTATGLPGAMGAPKTGKGSTRGGGGGGSRPGQGSVDVSVTEGALASDHTVEVAVMLARAKNVALTDFTPADRRDLLHRLLQDDAVVAALQRLLFDASKGDGGVGGTVEGIAEGGTP